MGRRGQVEGAEEWREGVDAAKTGKRERTKQTRGQREQGQPSRAVERTRMKIPRRTLSTFTPITIPPGFTPDFAKLTAIQPEPSVKETKSVCTLLP